jgi:hypothetical protein
VLIYEQEGKLKIGLEAYYFSPQLLNDGAMGQSYWVCGLMGEKVWKKVSLFLNFENLFDTRQTRFDTIYTGPIDDPTFRDIYAPLDGFVIKWRDQASALILCNDLCADPVLLQGDARIIAYLNFVGWQKMSPLCKSKFLIFSVELAIFNDCNH